ncbi:MAG: xanthine dehydrogenase family protein subunit M [Alphaproteobacteria bacterium]|nr:xanthine dehydrogenase family protein subunit M [Alphaproteobacteria bacterium]
MKPTPFAYAKPASLDAVFDLLAAHGEGARLLAGGQSLIPTLNLRLSSPSLLIDINGLKQLSGIALDGGTIRIGALTRHAEIERSPEIARHLPLIAEAVTHIGHAAIRNRGTLGGSLAFADPAAELPACAVALGATLVVASRASQRRVGATDFFKGLYATDLRPGEVLTAAEFPLPPPGYRSRFAELARRHGDYAMVGLAAHGRVSGENLSDLRLVFFGVGTRPMAAAAAARVLESQPVTSAGLAGAAAALARDLDPPDDLNGSGTTKLHLAGVLLGRVVAALIAKDS